MAKQDPRDQKARNNSFEEAYPIVRNLTEALPAPIVTVVGGVTYKGYAPLGTRQDNPEWKITRATVAGGTTTTEYADGNMEYDNVWADRLTLNYRR